MLFKLLKYDFRAMWKQFSLIWGAALVLALVNRFIMFRGPDGDIYTKADLLLFALMAFLMAMFVLAVIFVINRFSKGLLGGEGYLMHTLPVRSWQLVVSKLISGLAVWVGCGAVSFFVAFLMLPTEYHNFFLLPFWRDIFQAVVKHMDVVALIVEFCLTVLSAMIQFIAVIYLAIAVGHLFSRHRRLISVAAFIGLYILLMNVYNRVFSYGFVQDLVNKVNVNAYSSMLTAIATMLIPAALFLAAVCWILENKLNLE